MLPAEIGFDPARANNGTDARLIRELVAGIDKPTDILARYGLTETDLKAKLRDKGFVAAYKEAKAFWDSSPNTRDRIRAKAGALLEDGLQDMFGILKNENMPASSRLEASKQLASLHEGPKKDQGPTGPTTIIQIVRRGREPVTIHAEPRQQALEQS